MWDKSRIGALELKVIAVLALGRLAWVVGNGGFGFPEIVAALTIGVIAAAAFGQLARWFFRNRGRYVEIHDAQWSSVADDPNTSRTVTIMGIVLAVAIVVIRNVVGEPQDLAGTIWAQGFLFVGVLARISLLLRHTQLDQTTA